MPNETDSPHPPPSTTPSPSLAEPGQVTNRPRLDYRALRALIPIRAVLEELHYVPLQIRGDQWRGPCPLHASRDSSESCFAIHIRKHVFYCHRCQRGGNQLDLWAAAIHLPLYPASLHLCERLHLDPPLLPAIRNSQNRSA